jgi:hypothetical protein
MMGWRGGACVVLVLVLGAGTAYADAPTAPFVRTTGWERALLRAALNPDPSTRARRCGRFLAWELEHTEPGKAVRIQAAELGCGDIEFPAAYRVDDMGTGSLNIWRGDFFVAALVIPPPPPPILTMTVIDKRPKPAATIPPWRVTTERRVGGGLVLEMGRSGP